ncbi:MAG: hypothetical protein J6E32_06870 [Lachnospiraceae bacterium]|nr:hypothetical protein [Lachnospiraceae bacterium]
MIVVLDGYTENPGDISWKALEDLGEVTVYDRSVSCRRRQTISLRSPRARLSM